MLKSYYCVTYNFKTKDDGRIIYLRLLLFTENQNIHKCNSRIIIAISKVYDFIEYTMDYLSYSHLDKCGAEDKIQRYGFKYAVKSNPIKIDLHHYYLDLKTNHPHFSYVQDTFNTLEEHEILATNGRPNVECVKAIEVVHKYSDSRAYYPPICIDNLEQHISTTR